MDRKIEQMIINTFFSKSYRERLLFELFSTKKRKHAIGRLCHSYNDVLIGQYLNKIPKPNSDYIEIANLLKKFGAGEECYVISYIEDIDGRHLPLLAALERAVGAGMPSLISCMPDSLVYFEAEQSYGAPPRYILRKP